MVHSRMIYSQNPSGELHVIDDINPHRRLCHYRRLIFLRKLHWSNFTTFCRGVFLRVLARGANVDIGIGHQISGFACVPLRILQYEPMFEEVDVGLPLKPLGIDREV